MTTRVSMARYMVPSIWAMPPRTVTPVVPVMVAMRAKTPYGLRVMTQPTIRLMISLMESTPFDTNCPASVIFAPASRMPKIRPKTMTWMTLPSASEWKGLLGIQPMKEPMMSLLAEAPWRMASISASLVAILIPRPGLSVLAQKMPTTALMAEERNQKIRKVMPTFFRRVMSATWETPEMMLKKISGTMHILRRRMKTWPTKSRTLNRPATAALSMLGPRTRPRTQPATMKMRILMGSDIFFLVASSSIMYSSCSMRGKPGAVRMRLSPPPSARRPPGDARLYFLVLL